MAELREKLSDLRAMAIDEALPLTDRIIAVSQRLDLLTDFWLEQERQADG